MDTHASFLGLSSASRLRIYRIVIPQSDYPNNVNPKPSYSIIRLYKDAYNLMLTCRMTYAEASPMLYSGNHFSFDTETIGASQLCKASFYECGD